MQVITPLIRSKKLLAAAKGQPCTLRLPGICNSNPETTVSAHIRDQHKGMGQKASDYSIVFACSDCHFALDQGHLGDEANWYVVRGLQETWGLLIARGIIIVPLDPEKPASEPRSKPRKPPEQRQAIPARKDPWPKGRKLQSRNDLARRQS